MCRPPAQWQGGVDAGYESHLLRTTGPPVSGKTFGATTLSISQVAAPEFRTGATCRHSGIASRASRAASEFERTLHPDQLRAAPASLRLTRDVLTLYDGANSPQLSRDNIREHRVRRPPSGAMEQTARRRPASAGSWRSHSLCSRSGHSASAGWSQQARRSAGFTPTTPTAETVTVTETSTGGAASSSTGSAKRRRPESAPPARTVRAPLAVGLGATTRIGGMMWLGGIDAGLGNSDTRVNRTFGGTIPGGTPLGQSQFDTRGIGKNGGAHCTASFGGNILGGACIDGGSRGASGKRPWLPPHIKAADWDRLAKAEAVHLRPEREPHPYASFRRPGFS